MSFRRTRPEERVTTSSRRVRKPSSAQRRKAERDAARDAAGEDVSLAFGSLLVLMPVSAILSSAIGAASGFVTPLEALVSVALTALFVVLLLEGDRGNRVGRWVGSVLVGGIIGVVRVLTPLPILGSVVRFLGITLALWLPVAILAVVAVLIAQS
jgi:hypothetical protein